MKLAIVHQLPLEIYPPATNALTLFAGQEGLEIQVWSSDNHKGLARFEADGIPVIRHDYPGFKCGSLQRLWGFLRWHWRVARDLHDWQPDVVLSIEPHSALAPWIHRRLLRGKSRIMVHHHEYYSPADFKRSGNRTVRICRTVEESCLYREAEWVSQTNQDRLDLMAHDLPFLKPSQLGLWPNYPPESWLRRAEGAAERRQDHIGLRIICVGSLSFEDTYVREIVTWSAAHGREIQLHLCGYNVHQDVWEWLRKLAAPNVSFDPNGCPYAELPDLLTRFDVALVLYKGNTANFVHNIPNKVIEALACGLEVWYPQEMTTLTRFRDEHPELPLRALAYKDLPDKIPTTCIKRPVSGFSAESASAALLSSILHS